MLAPALLVGIGVSGTLDEVVLHQLLRWHHFYDRSSAATGLVTDGLLHLFSTAALAAGLLMLWRRGADALPGWRKRTLGGVLAGAGAFNLYDGTIQHKLLRLHQVREGASDQLPYDLVYIGLAAAALALGVALLRSRRPERR